MTRCRELSGQLLALMKFEAAVGARAWNAARYELNFIVSESRQCAIDQWIDRGALSVEAAEALIEAHNELSSIVFCYCPDRIDPNKRRLSEPLKRFLHLTSPRTVR